MSTNTLFFIELFLVHGAVLAWAVWEVWSLRRDKRRAAAAVEASAERAGHAEGEQGADPGRAQTP
jgi:hypothetical protein